MEYKRCTACGFEHPVTSFNKYKRNGTKLRAECKSCTSYRNKMDYLKRKFKSKLIEDIVREVKAPSPRVNVWEWIKRLFG